jgi:hypothetical protein
VRGDGSVRLAACVRHTDHDDYRGRPVFDSIVLSATAWRGLLPPRLVAGTTFAVPEAVAREFSRIVSSSSDLSNLIRPSDLTTARLEGTVKAPAAPNDGREVWFHGELAGSRRYVNGSELLPGRASINGVLRLDEQGQPLDLLLVCTGVFKMPWEPRERPTGAVVEWRMTNGKWQMANDE